MVEVVDLTVLVELELAVDIQVELAVVVTWEEEVLEPEVMEVPLTKVLEEDPADKELLSVSLDSFMAVAVEDLLVAYMLLVRQVDLAAEEKAVLIAPTVLIQYMDIMELQAAHMEQVAEVAVRLVSLKPQAALVVLAQLALS
jgi:hypothetical protein